MACKVSQDFWCCGITVIGRIGRVFELAGHKPTMLFCKCFGSCDHAGTPLCRWGEYDARAKGLHYFSAFNREGFDHGGNKRVALGSTNHRQGNACVAGSRLNHRLAWFNRTASLSIFNDRNSQSVLDRGHGVKGFDFGINGLPSGRHFIQANNGRIPNGS